MTTIRATVRGGRIEVDEPIDLPDGTQLLIPIPNGEADDEMGPEEIARVLAAMDRLEPLEMTEAELAAWEADRQARKEAEKADFARRAARVEGLWP
jgi:hypothetical protein